MLKKRLRHMHYRNANELFDAVQEEWARIPQETLQELVESMPRRMRAVIKAKGYATKYLLLLCSFLVDFVLLHCNKR